MVAYAFPAALIGALSSGSQSFTLQPPRSSLSRHAQVGERITLRLGSARAATALGALCILRAKVHLAPDGIRRVLDEHRSAFHMDPASAILARFVNAENGAANAARDREALAVALGHADYAALWAATTRVDKGKLKGGVYQRELVGWRLS